MEKKKLKANLKKPTNKIIKIQNLKKRKLKFSKFW